MSADFDILSERPAPSEASFVTIDPHGRYLAVGTRHNALHLINRHGRPAGRLETMEPLSHLCFVPGRPIMVGAAAFGMLVGIELEPSRSSGGLDPEIIWQDRLMSNVGRLALDGEGSMILASCFTLGIQRFDLTGRNEGSYHLGGTVSHAVPDFPGRTVAAATLEGELVLMNSAGNVRWRTRLARPVIALEMDPLGRYMIYGHATGEIVRHDLFGGSQAKATARPERRASSGAAAAQTQGPTVRTAAGSVRAPDWVVQAVESDQQAETAVLAVVDDPPMIALFTSPHRLRLYRVSGEEARTRPRYDGRRPDHPVGPRLAGRGHRPPDRPLRSQAEHRPAHRCQPGPAHSSCHKTRRVRPGSDPGARSDRPLDHGRALGVETRIADDHRGARDRSRRGGRGDHQRRVISC